MPLNARAVFTTSDGRPLASADVQLCTFSLDGSVRVLGTARTGADGSVNVATAWQPPGDYQPRLQLRAMRGAAFVEATENPVTFAGSAVDFGPVRFDPVLTATYRIAVATDAVADDRTTTALLAERTTLTTRITSLEAERTRLTASLADSSRTAEALRADVGSLTVAKTALESRVAALEAERPTLVAQAQAPLRAQLDAQTKVLSARNDELQILRDKIATLEKGLGAEVPVKNLVASTSLQVQHAQEQLQSQNSAFRVANFSMTLRGLAGKDGESMAFPAAGELAQMKDAVSELKFDLVQPAPAQAPRTPAARTVPSVVGYTEVMARRKLAEARLPVHVTRQAVAAEVQVGRVVSQSPPQGAPIAQDTVVAVAIGTKG